MILNIHVPINVTSMFDTRTNTTMTYINMLFINLSTIIIIDGLNKPLKI